MITYEPNTILRIWDNETRIATARVLPEGYILEVNPRSFKMYKTAYDWLSDQSSYNELKLHAETPEDRAEARFLQQELKKEAEAVRLAFEPADIQKVRRLYDELHLKDSLTKEGWRKRRTTGLWVELGDEILPVWFSRKTGCIALPNIDSLISFAALGKTYKGVFYSRLGKFGLKRIS